LSKTFVLGNHYKNNEVCPEFKKEFFRIYNADTCFIYLTPKNALNLFRINSALRFIPLHLFGVAYVVKP